MNATRAKKRALLLARVLLLATSLAALGVYWVWGHAPEWVHRVDEGLVKRHLAGPTRRLQQARELLDTGDRPQGVTALEDLADELSGVAKGERLAKVKREALSLLAAAHAEAGRSAEALAIYDEWIAYDARDITPQLARAILLGDEGVPILEDLLRRFPRAPAVAAHREVLRASAGRGESLVRIDQMLRSGGSPSAWQVFWDDGRGFREKASQHVRPEVGPDGSWAVPLVFASDALDKLRLDAPAHEVLWLEGGTVELSRAGETRRLRLADLELRAADADVYPQAELIRFESRDPRVWFEVPPGLRGGGELRVRFDGTVRVGLPRAMDRALMDPKNRAAVEDLRAERGPGAAAALDGYLALLERIQPPAAASTRAIEGEGP